MKFELFDFSFEIINLSGKSLLKFIDGALHDKDKICFQSLNNVFGGEREARSDWDISIKIGSVNKIEVGLIIDELLLQKLLAYLFYVIILNGLGVDYDVFLFALVTF